MTLAQLFEHISEAPAGVVFYFSLIPFTALLAGWMSRGEGHEPPWSYLYSALLYLVAVPGIFAFTLDIYLFIFERRSIMDTNLYTQVLPIVSMLITFLIVRNNVDLDAIPGFGKLSGLITMITATLAIMWFIDRTHIVVFSYLRFEYVILIFIALLVIIRIGWARFARA